VDTEEENLTFLKADWEEARVEKSFSKSVQAPVQKDEVLGTISYGVGETVLYTYEIRAGDAIFLWDFPSFLRAFFKELPWW
jgi:hypothetical protein